MKLLSSYTLVFNARPQGILYPESAERTGLGLFEQPQLSSIKLVLGFLLKRPDLTRPVDTMKVLRKFGLRQGKNK